MRKWMKLDDARCSIRMMPTMSWRSTSVQDRTRRAVEDTTRRKLQEFARRADGITAEADHKLQGGVRELKALLKDGFQPVVFCRFVDTADYVARQLRESLPARVRIESVTGLLPPSEREARIDRLAAEGGEYVLVWYGLSVRGGWHLQQHFNAVLHYDLAWNPTRHEQREGRVDRFGQEKREVRVVSTTAPITRSTESSSMCSSASTRASRVISASRWPSPVPASRSQALLRAPCSEKRPSRAADKSCSISWRNWDPEAAYSR